MVRGVPWKEQRTTGRGGAAYEGVAGIHPIAPEHPVTAGCNPGEKEVPYGTVEIRLSHP